MKFLVAIRPGETPVPIPNTMVKTRAADGTILETIWESRWLPEQWGLSSAGRAPALQAGGREFESLSLHDGRERCRQEQMWLSVLAQGQTHLFLSIVRTHVMK